MLSVCIQSSLAATLVNDGASLLDGGPQDQPLSLDVWLDARSDPPAAAAAPTVAAPPRGPPAAASVLPCPATAFASPQLSAR